jgi:hypothetical protein
MTGVHLVHQQELWSGRGEYRVGQKVCNRRYTWRCIARWTQDCTSWRNLSDLRYWNPEKEASMCLRNIIITDYTVSRCRLVWWLLGFVRSVVRILSGTPTVRVVFFLSRVRHIPELPLSVRCCFLPKPCTSSVTDRPAMQAVRPFETSIHLYHC